MFAIIISAMSEINMYDQDIEGQVIPKPTVKIDSRPWSQDDQDLYGSQKGKRDYRALASGGMPAFLPRNPKETPLQRVVKREIFHNMMQREFATGVIATTSVAEVVPILPASLQGQAETAPSVQEVA
jgi:hypothetical protein